MAKSKTITVYLHINHATLRGASEDYKSIDNGRYYRYILKDTAKNRRLLAEIAYLILPCLEKEKTTQEITTFDLEDITAINFALMC